VLSEIGRDERATWARRGGESDLMGAKAIARPCELEFLEARASRIFNELVRILKNHN